MAENPGHRSSRDFGLPPYFLCDHTAANSSSFSLVLLPITSQHLGQLPYPSYDTTIGKAYEISELPHYMVVASHEAQKERQVGVDNSYKVSTERALL